MNQNNSRIEEIVEDFITRFSVNIADIKTTKELAKYWIRKTLLELNETHHQQLQKARHDWLREEIVRLEGMKNIVGSQTEISSNESLVKMVKNVIELKGEMAYNQALQTIIDRYHSELDQPTRDDWNEDMEHSHGLNELDQPIS